MEKIYLEKLVKKNYLVIENHSNDNNEPLINELGSILKSFESLGYTLDKESIERLSRLNSSDLTTFYFTNYKLLNQLCGNNVNHKIFYKNFPNVSHISDEEFYIRAILHYLTVDENTDGFMSQDIKDCEREEIHNPNKQSLKVISEIDAQKLLIENVRELFSSKVAIPYYEDDFLVEAFKDFEKKIFISEIPFKENVAKFVNTLVKANGKELSASFLSKHLSFVKTSTDLLRVYAILSKGDFTLRKNVKFISLKRSIRRLFLRMLDEIAYNSNIIDDLAKHEFLWKKAFEKLHVGEYKNQYPFISEAATFLRTGEYVTYYGMLEQNKNNQKALINLLKQRPGEFARRLDYLIRNERFDLEYTLSSFKEVARSVSTTVLLGLWEFFKNRTLYPTRIFKINRQYDSIYKEIPDERAVVDEEVVSKVLSTIEDALADVYSTYENKGKVYIDANIKGYALPINSRNGSSQNKTLTFGTRVKLEETEDNYLRFFTHFKNFEGKDGRVDVDLSLEFVDENFTESFSLSWHDMGGGRKFDSFHSGDITSAPKGASEFVDLDYKKARNYARYVLVTNSVYTGQDFADIPECFSGVMFMPEKGKRGKVFNPEFVKYKFDLTQKGSNQNIAFAVDLETLELIWIDSPFSYGCCGIVASGNDSIVLALKNALKTHMSLYDFFMLHKKHIEIVKTKEDANIIISDSDDATLKPFDVETISSKWL